MHVGESKVQERSTSSDYNIFNSDCYGSYTWNVTGTITHFDVLIRFSLISRIVWIHSIKLFSTFVRWITSSWDMSLLKRNPLIFSPPFLSQLKNVNFPRVNEKTAEWRACNKAGRIFLRAEIISRKGFETLPLKTGNQSVTNATRPR